MKKNYFKNIETGDIYKESGDKFGYQYLKVTPWETGEDRRTNINVLKKLELEGKVIKLPFAKAREEVNLVWNNTDRYWCHEGKEYKTLADVSLYGYETMSKASVLWRSAFFIVQLSHLHNYWKNHSFD